MYNDDGYEEASKLSEEDEQELLEKIKKDISSWYGFFSDNYERGRLDKEFALSSQWTPAEEAEIQAVGLPTLQNNMLYNITKTIIGQFREVTPNLQILAKDVVLDDNDDQQNIALQKKINLLTNLIRNIAYGSESDIAYQTAFENIIYMGYGALRVNYKYDDANSFDTKATIETVRLPETCFFDPSDVISPTKSDGNFCGIYYQMTKEEFEECYPDVEWSSSLSVGSQYVFEWCTEDTITLVDYYYKEYFHKDIVMMSNGQVIEESEVDDYIENAKDSGIMVSVLRKRRAKDFKIMHCKICRDKILERSEFPSRYLPVIFVDGHSYMLDNRQVTQSFVDKAKDNQRILNYTLISMIHSLKSIRKEQFIAPLDSISGKGITDIWRTPEKVVGVLPYNPSSGKPEKLPAGEISQSLQSVYARAEEDLQKLLGVFDSNLGAPTSEVTGVAIKAKQQYGNLSTVIYRDNLVRGMQAVGRCILSMIQRIYDTERNVSVMNQDKTVQSQRINKMGPDGEIENDITKGDYDLIIEAGVSFDDRKEAMLNLLLKAVSINPQVFPLIADLFADSLDVENRPQLVERFKTLVPPTILAKENGQPPPPPPPPQADPQMMVAMQKLQLEQEQIQQENQKLMLDANDQQVKERIAQMELVGKVIESQGNQSDVNQKVLKSVAEMYKTHVDDKGKGVDFFSKLLDNYRNA